MGRVCPDLQGRREDAGGRCPADGLLPVLCGLLWEILPRGPAGKPVAKIPGNFTGLNYCHCTISWWFVRLTWTN